MVCKKTMVCKVLGMRRTPVDLCTAETFSILDTFVLIHGCLSPQQKGMTIEIIS